MSVPPTKASQRPSRLLLRRFRNKKAFKSWFSEHADRESQIRTHKLSMEQYCIPLYALSRIAPYQQPAQGAQWRSRSEASGVSSTYMFQSSLLGFPDDIGKKENNDDEADYFTTGARRILWSPSQSWTQFLQKGVLIQTRCFHPHFPLNHPWIGIMEG